MWRSERNHGYLLGSCPLVKAESLPEAWVHWLANKHWESTCLSLPRAGITSVGHLTTGNSGSNSGSRVCGSAFYQLKSLSPPLSRVRVFHLSPNRFHHQGQNLGVCTVENKMSFIMAVQLASKLLLNRILLFHADLQHTIIIKFYWNPRPISTRHWLIPNITISGRATLYILESLYVK